MDHEVSRRHDEWESLEAIEELTKHKATIESIVQELNAKEVPVRSEHFKYVPQIGIYLEYPGILRAICPDLVRDDDGLFSLNSMCQCLDFRRNEGGFIHADKYVLLVHPTFRRSMHPLAGYAPRFVDEFLVMTDGEIVTSIALDEHRIAIYTDGSIYKEFDTWFGQPFNQDIRTLKEGTVKLRPPAYLNPIQLDMYYKNAFSLDIKWSDKGTLRTFQAEEYKRENVTYIAEGGEEFFPVRYVHAQYDLDLDTFIHFDGALHLYDIDEYFARRDGDFNYNAKNDSHIKARSFKTFRMDGAIAQSAWSNLTTHFFAGNPLIVEYFTGRNSEMLEVILKLAEKGLLN